MSSEKNASAGEPTAEAFLDILQKKDIVPGGTLAALRKQVAESKAPISSRQVAKVLVDKGLLTAATAQHLLGKTKPPAKPQAAKGQPPNNPVGQTSESVHASRGTDSEVHPTKGQPPKAAAPPVDSGLASLLEEELSSLSTGLPSLGAGPLDALLSDPSLAEAVQEPRPLDAPAPRKKGFFRSFGGAGWGSRRARRRLWAWIGSAAAGVLAVIAVSVWVATRPDPNKLLQPADAAYQEGNFAEAIKQYDAFLERYPKFAASGRVRVRRGLARLRLAEASGESAALAAAKTVLPAISPEAEFDAEAGPVLAALLPPLVETSASRVQRHPDPAALGQSEELLALAQQYIPAADKPREHLGRAEAVLALVRHKAAGGDELKKTLGAIQQAVAAKDFNEAYRVRTALLNAYPQFSTHDELTEAVANISAAEQAAVAWVAKQQPGEKEPAAAAISTVIMAQRTFIASPPGAEGHVIFATAAGAINGLDAASGKLLWRTFVSFDPDGRDEGCTPIAVAPQADSEVVMSAAAHREVQRVEATTGRVKWRYAVAEGLCGDPIVADDQVLAATRSGRLVVIDAAKGSSAGYAQFPQALGVAPAVDPSRKLVFQAADCDNLFVLAMPGMRCRQVFPLGHRPGSIVAPPAVFGDCLLVAVNDTAGESSLRVLKIQSGEPQSTDPPLRLLQTIPLKGHVDVGPSIAGERLLLATDNGDVHLLERSPAGVETPLREVTRMRLEGGPGLVRFPLLQPGTCLVGDAQLASFQIDPAKNQLSPAWRDTSQGAVCQTPAVIGQTVFYVRHAGDLPAVVVSAVSADKGGLCWRTCLAAPLAGEPAVSPDGRKVTAVTALGGVFVLPAVGWASQPVQDGPGGPSYANKGHAETIAAVDRPTAAPPPSFNLHRPVTGAMRCGEILALTGGSGSDQVLAFDPADPQKPLVPWMLPAPLACRPIAIAGGLLAPLSVGQIYLLDPLSGNGLCAPFQPRLQPGALPSWRGPVAVGEKEVVISDGRNKLYRLQLVDKPAMRRDVAAAVELAEPIVSSLATTGKAVCGVDAAGKLDFFQLPDLARSQQHALAGRCAWGPCRIGNRVMLATEGGLYYCFDESGQLVWQAALPYGRLAGTPLAVKDHYLLAAASGVVWRAEAASGKDLAKVDVGRPLATGPVLLGDRLLIGGHDGSLYQIAAP